MIAEKYSPFSDSASLDFFESTKDVDVFRNISNQGGFENFAGVNVDSGSFDTTHFPKKSITLLGDFSLKNQKNMTEVFDFNLVPEADAVTYSFLDTFVSESFVSESPFNTSSLCGTSNFRYSSNDYDIEQW